jgi:Protein of unknown function (DUF1552)
MGNFRLSRRAMLRGAGGVAIALPWLEIMGVEKSASAQSAVAAKRFLTVFQPGGTVTFTDKDGTVPSDRFWPTGTTDAPVMNTINKPLAAIQNKILFLQGLKMGPANTGEQHQEGIVGLLTGSKQVGGDLGYSAYASIDQVLAQRFATAATPFTQPTLEMAVRWATGKSHGRLSAINSLTFGYEGKHSPIEPQIDPQRIFKMFANLGPDTSGDRASEIARTKSVLDLLDKRYVKLGARLGAADKAKLDEHLEKIRKIELNLDTIVQTTNACKAPAPVDTTGYNPATGLQSADNGSVVDTSTDSLIPQVGHFMMDMMVLAMACDLTRVGTFQWTDTEAKHTFPWLNLNSHHHFYQHDGGFKPDECTKIDTWYAEQHAYLLTAMSKVDMGGHSLLDESVVFFGSELSHPGNHRKDNMPFILAGNGGGLKTGRHLKFPTGSSQRTSNDLLVSILNLFGDMRTSYGEPVFNHGALSLV